MDVHNHPGDETMVLTKAIVDTSQNLKVGESTIKKNRKQGSH